MPVTAVAPVTVMLEKILLLQLPVTPVASIPSSVKNKTVPPAPALLNPVTMELPLTFFTPVAEAIEFVFEMNVGLPVVLRLRFVNVLVLIV